MADLADIAQERIDVFTTAALSKTNVYTGESARCCVNCQEPIPDERRRAIPGCSLCIDCQREKEIRGRNFV